MEHVGPENIFIFGLTAAEVEERRRARWTGEQSVVASPRLQQVVAALRDGTFSPDRRDRFQPLVDALLGYDHFMVAADFDAYWNAQRAVDQRYGTPAWWRASILNTARMGWFSSDRAVREYAEKIWGIALAR